MDFRYEIRRFIRKVSGFDLHNFNAMNSYLARRILLLQHYGVDTIYDVGANEGQYVKEMRDLGFTGRFVSFEPLTAPFSVLAKRAHRDERWNVEQTALGEAASSQTIHVAEYRRVAPF